MEAVGVGAELCEHALCLRRPVDDEAPRASRREHDPEQVALGWREPFDLGEQQGLCAVPCQELPPRPEDIRGRGGHGFDQSHELIGAVSDRGTKGSARSAKAEGGVFRWVELQRAGDRNTDVTRRCGSVGPARATYTNHDTVREQATSSRRGRGTRRPARGRPVGIGDEGRAAGPQELGELVAGFHPLIGSRQHADHVMATQRSPLFPRSATAVYCGDERPAFAPAATAD